MADELPWYIHDQEWRVLQLPDQNTDPTKWLQPELMRPRQNESVDQELQKNWIVVQDRDAIVFNRRQVFHQNGQPIDFRRMVFVSDAGMGKTYASKWMEYRLCKAERGERAAGTQAELVVWMEIREFAKGWTAPGQTLNLRERLASIVAPQLREKVNRGLGCNPQGAVAVPVNTDRFSLYLQGVIRRGQLCLILDGLDQVGDDQIKSVQEVLQSSDCQRCRFILAGRPSAVGREATWERLFADQRRTAGSAWAWVQVRDWTPRQQKRYLGWDEQGKLRYGLIPRDSRPILSVPRVLKYLRKENAANLQKMKTASMVYAGAIRHMLEEALSKTSHDGPIDIDTAEIDGFEVLLALTAWEVIRSHQGDGCITLHPETPMNARGVWEYLGQPSRPGGAKTIKYDYNMEQGQVFSKVRARIKQRYRNLECFGDFDKQWQLLGKLNAVLHGGLFDNHLAGLNQIFWSNRSLHEFCLAFYFAAYAEPGEEYRLWEWLYLPDQTATDDYYQFWQFLAEMPEHKRDPQNWLRSISILYWPGIPDAAHSDERPQHEQKKNPKGRYYAKRSNEMIYRSWKTLLEYSKSKMADVRQEAQRILDVWQGEFEGLFLAGTFGEQPRQTAVQITQDFLRIEQRPFVMGTTDEKVIPPEVEKDLSQAFVTGVADPVAFCREFFDKWTSRAAMVQREIIEPAMKRALKDEDFKAFVLAVNYGNNRRYDLTLPVAGQNSANSHVFHCARRSVTNAWYRLYDSTWGFKERQSWYQQYSETAQHPAIALSFYDSWVFCQWLFWDGRACRLLWEDEWEYCAKLGFKDDDSGAPQWHWDFWFGEVYDAKKHEGKLNCRELGHGKTMIADKSRASPASRDLDPRGDGLMDFQGSHWVWCQDEYRARYVGRQESDAAVNAHVSRVVRGGSFHGGAVYARCSLRYVFVPSSSFNLTGCRVARAEI
jgi:formylglycine-generating enzyme required for sulfatase activity